jgi:hypothetical protein
MKRLYLVALAALAGCLNAGDSQSNITLDFDFNVFGNDWIPGAADYPEAQAAAVGLVGDLRTLPAPLSTVQKALYLKGTNVSGDLFLYQSKFIPGLAPSTQYLVSLQVEYATNYHAGCSAGPGPLTVIKAGLSSTALTPGTDAQGVVRVDLDKGTGTNPGDYTQLGDIKNNLTGCPASGTFAIRTTGLQRQSAVLMTDSQGGFFIFIGTQSSFVGSHEIYITKLRVVLS